MGFGRLPSAFAALALVIILAVAVAIVALNGTKASAPATSGAKGAPPPAVIDHGWSSTTKVAPAIPEGTSPFGGFGGPAAAPVYKGDNSKEDRVIIENRHESGSNGPRLRPQ
jgi:hypothetical protein